MVLSPVETLIIIGCVVFGTMITRFLPFVLFPEKKEPPQWITNLGKTLPPAMMGLLVVYCLKSVSFVQFPFGLPEFISIIFIVGIHLWKRNVLMSIGLGTALYMVLVQVIFI